MKIKKPFKLIFGISVCFVMITIAAFNVYGNEELGLQGNTRHRLAVFMDRKALDSRFNGVILVAKDGKSLFEKGYGFANKEEYLPNQLNTQFRIASLTKSFTAISILQLESQGKLKTSDPISKYIDHYPDGNKITIHHLLTHSSGLADHFKLTDTTKPITLKSFIDLMKKQALTFSPGTNYKYSNTGYMMLAYIIEKVSGISYENYFQKHIFQPAGMTHTFFRKADAKLFAVGYRNMKKVAETDDESQLAGAGDLISTAGDLLKYNNALHDFELLSPVAVKKMETGYINTSKWGVFKYGYGWKIANNFISYRKPMIEHNGSLPGFKSEIVDFVKDRVTVIILSNNNSTWNSGALARELASLCLGTKFWFYQNYF